MNPLQKLYLEQREESKKVFEANFLDGDKVQEGQTLSSDFCYEAIQSSHQSNILAVIGEVKRWAEENRPEGESEFHDSYNDGKRDICNYLLNFLSEGEKSIKGRIIIWK